ncbi:hypothetical protein GCM10009549_29870 [Streptomyces thermoalcalitolerans]|uniref:HNH endonuclease n=1 Tax=Streptomyces thermoalcalitolerans TaxID=65605 RepID=A0ABP3Z7W7_9ACTN
MRLRVAAFARFEYSGQTYVSGDLLDVPDDAALGWLRSGLVVPADDSWPDGVFIDAASAAQPAQAPRPGPRQPEEPAEEPEGSAEGQPCGTCDPPARKTGKTLSTCPTPGCPCLTTGGKCKGCRQAHDRRRNKRADRRAYQAKDWQQTRRAYLREHPLCECEDCAEIPEPLRPAAQVVDHIGSRAAGSPWP